MFTFIDKFVTPPLMYFEFLTSIGPIRLSWHDKTIREVHLLEAPLIQSRKKQRQTIATQSADRADVPAWVQSWAQKICRHVDGHPQDFSTCPLDMTGLSDFAKSVYHATREIPSGQVKTYESIAKNIGNPGSARAVGGALRRNPFLIIIPCHRVIGKNGGLRGFMGPKGTHTKRRLLDLESLRPVKLSIT